MQNPMLEEIQKENSKYVKRYIQEKDYWAVWNFIFTGKLVDTLWLQDPQ
jgi:predicted patatin/cPLA2 family phospholipase